MAGQSWQGAHSTARTGKTEQGKRFNYDRRIELERGKAGTAWMARNGVTRCVKNMVRTRQARQGSVRQSKFWRSKIWISMVWQGRHGKVGTTRYGEAWRVMADGARQDATR